MCAQLLISYGSSSAGLLWFAVPVLGFSIGPLFPTAMTLAERYVDMAISVSTALVIGASVGEMSFPAIATFLVPSNPAALWLIAASTLIGLIGCVAAIHFLFVPRVRDDHQHATGPLDGGALTAPQVNELHAITVPKTVTIVKAPARSSHAPLTRVQVLGAHEVEVEDDDDDPNIDWVEFERMYGPRKAAKTRTAK